MEVSDEMDGMAAYVNAINNPSRDDPNWPLPSFDAKDWAEAFCRLFPGHDEGVMLSWSANALMRGYDEHAIRAALAVMPDQYRAGWIAGRDAAADECLREGAAIQAEEYDQYAIGKEAGVSSCVRIIRNMEPPE